MRRQQSKHLPGLMLLAIGLLFGTAASSQVLKGHGGPIMGVTVSQDGASALTASFDNSVGLWNLDDGSVVWLEGHEAAVNSVHFIGEGRAASAGDDFAIEIWDLESGSRLHRIVAHKGKVMALASSQGRLASASWDGTAVIWDIETGEPILKLSGHKGNVNDVAFLEAGGFVTASSDGTIRIWDAEGSQAQILVRHGFGVNTLIVNEAGGWLAYGAVDGGTRAVDFNSGEVLADLTLERRPVLAMAARPDLAEIAVGDGQGFIMVVDTGDWSISRDFRAAKNGPIWALSYTADGENLIAGGIDDTAHFFPLGKGAEVTQMATEQREFHKRPETMSNGERQFRRKCSVCHTLGADDARRAGPSLVGIFGRPAGRLEGYSFSDAMAGSDLVWSAETIDKLFDLGPDNYVPGSKMPMQRITKAQDRRDLIEFLRQTTGE